MIARSERCFWHHAHRFDSPDDGPVKANRWGAKAEPPVFSISGGFAVNALMHVARKYVMAGRINWRRLGDRDRCGGRASKMLKAGHRSSPNPRNSLAVN